MKKLQKVLIYHLNEAKQVQEEISNEKYLEMFLTAKQIEGCSDRTIQYYRVTIEHMLKRITIPLRQIATEDIRQYLIDYQQGDTYGRVFIVGLLNTLLVSALCIVFASVLGFFIGLARLSDNWLLRKLSTIYIEIFRNIPPLLQIFFWYFS